MLRVSKRCICLVLLGGPSYILYYICLSAAQSALSKIYGANKDVKHGVSIGGAGLESGNFEGNGLEDHYFGT